MFGLRTWTWCSIAIYLATIAVVSEATFHDIHGILARKKPILSYLIHYKLGHVKAKLHGAHEGHGLEDDECGPNVEHFHHYYLEPYPQHLPPSGPFHPHLPPTGPYHPHQHLDGPFPPSGGHLPLLAPPVVLPLEHGNHLSHFSLKSPYHGHKVSYDHYFDVPKSFHH